MELLNLFGQDQTAEKKYLALYITVETVQAAFWQISAGEIAILQISPALSFTDDESCLTQTDIALQELGAESEDVSEVLLALDASWIADGIVAQAKQPFLQKLVTNLSLKPVGFVIAKDALRAWASKQDPMVSCFYIEVLANNMSVALLIRGKLFGIEQVGRSADVGADVQEAIARVAADLQNDHLPPTMRIFSATGSLPDIEEWQHKLQQVAWQDKFKFLHQPVIEILPADTVMKAVITEAGTNVARQQGIVLVDKSATHDQEDNEFSFAPVANLADDADLSVETDTTPPNLPPVEGDNFVASDWPEKAVEDTDVSTWSTKVRSDDLDSEEDEEQLVAHGQSNNLKRFSMLNIKGWLSKITNRKRKAEHQSSKKQSTSNSQIANLGRWRWPILAGVGGGVIVLFVVGFWLASQQTIAEITIKLKPQSVSKQVEIMLDANLSAPNVADRILPATTISQKESGQKTADTTGVKLVGETAKGKITIANKTSTTRALAKGTQLSSGNLQFLLDEDVSVPSASASANNLENVSGKVVVNVTAKQIGAESNLNKDTQLAVASFNSDQLVAVVNEMGGGTSREVRAVAAADQQKLKTALQEELTKKATQQLQNNAAAGAYNVPTGTTKVTKSQFSADVGDEVNTLALDMTVEVAALSYLAQDLKPLATQVLQSELTNNMELVAADPQILSAAEPASKSGKPVISAQITSQAVPKVDKANLATALAGQPISEVKALIAKQVSQIQDVQVLVKPRFIALILSKLPQQVERIKIELQH